MPRKKQKQDEPAVAPQPEEEVALPPKPWVMRDGKAASITDAGLEVVRILAASGSGQRHIASVLEMAQATLLDMMKRDERVRLQYEAGLAEEERVLVRGLRAAAAAGAWVPALFLLKSRHGFVEGAPPPSTAPNIMVVLPQARTTEDYLRDLQAREAAVPALSPPEVEVVETLPQTKRSVVR